MRAAEDDQVFAHQFSQNSDIGEPFRRAELYLLPHLGGVVVLAQGI